MPNDKLVSKISLLRARAIIARVLVLRRVLALSARYLNLSRYPVNVEAVA